MAIIIAPPRAGLRLSGKIDRLSERTNQRLPTIFTAGKAYLWKTPFGVPAIKQVRQFLFFT